MDPPRRIFWFVIAAVTPTFFLVGALAYQLQKVDIANRNTEMELLLGRQARQRRRPSLEETMRRMEGEDSGSAEEAPAG